MGPRGTGALSGAARPFLERPRLATFVVEPQAGRRGTVVLVHGLLATARIFHVPGPPPGGPNRWLSEAGYRVLSFDQRGTGASRAAAADSRFGFAVAVEDLCGVLEQAADAGESMVLMGHSLGGTLAHAALLLGEREGMAFPRHVAGVATVASPLRFLPRAGTWGDLFSPRALAILEELETAGGWMDLAEFLLAQARLAGRLPRRLVPAALPVVRASLWLACRFAPVGWLLMHAPGRLPTQLFAEGDYSARDFQYLLACGAMDRAPVQLVRELLSWGMESPGGGPPRLDHGGEVLDVAEAAAAARYPVLSLASRLDAMVTVAEAHGLPPREGLREAVVEPPCGHGGFFTRPGSREAVRREVLAFLDPLFPRP